MGSHTGPHLFQKGHSGNPAGKKPGTKDRKKRICKSVVAMVIDTLRQIGGGEWLEKLARENPALYVKLLEKAMPSEVNISGEMTFEERLKIAQGTQVIEDADDEENNEGQVEE